MTPPDISDTQKQIDSIKGQLKDVTNLDKLAGINSGDSALTKLSKYSSLDTGFVDNISNNAKSILNQNFPKVDLLLLLILRMSQQ